MKLKQLEKGFTNLTFFVASERLSLEERKLEVKLAQLNKDLARTAEELARACALSAESESAAIQAALVADRATAEAAKTQVTIWSMPFKSL